MESVSLSARWRNGLAIASSLWVASLLAAPLLAQGRIRTLPRATGVISPATKPAASAGGDAEKTDSETRFPGGASLKTDRELERLLDRAAQFAQNKRFDLASVLWQRILDESGDVLRSSDGRLYTALANEVEQLLKSMPDEARLVYRIKADGEAQALLAQVQGENSEGLLGKIVRHYFMSSVGDDAAYQLACLALDRQDFVGARRLLERALREHPDCSVPRGALLIRHAVAAARSGDLEAARQSLVEARKAPDLDDVDLLARIEEVISAAAASDASLTALETGEWPMPWGSSSRKGLMPALKSEVTSSTLTDYWSRTLQVDAAAFLGPPEMGGIARRPGVAYATPFLGGRSGKRYAMPGGGMAVDPRAAQPVNAVEAWKRANWIPTTQLAFSSGSVLIRTRNDLEAWQSNQLGVTPQWASAWANSYDLDSMSQSMVMMGLADPTMPMGAEGIRAFGDRIHGMSSVVGGVVYTIEGRRYSKQPNSGALPAQEQRQQPWGVVPRRARTNFLAAYDAQTGKALWNRPASDDATSTQDVGFLSAPTPCGELLLAPITDAGTIYLYALHPLTGATVWKSYLCDEPPGGASPWTPAMISVEGADAYVVCGTGVVFSVDGLSGAIRWAVRYDRDSLRAARTQQNYNGVPARFRTPGWEDDLAIPVGKALVIFSSDQNQNGESQLFAIDRLTGDFLWQSPRISPFNTDASYFLGVWKRGVIVAGKNIVRMYDAVSGRLVWDKELKQSLGRGALTSDAIYVPDRDSIVILDPATGKERKQVGVRLSSGDPIGNLYVDGKQIWVANHDRVYALTNLELRLAELAKRISDGDAEARVTRIQLYDRLDRAADAFPDLEALFLSQVKTDPAKAHQTLLDFVRSLRLVNTQPIKTLELLTRIHSVSDASIASAELEKYRARRNDSAISAINSLTQNRAPGAVDAILAARPLFNSPQLVFAAGSALRRVAAKTDSAKLAAVFDSPEAAAKKLVAPALAQHGDEKGIALLTAALKSNDEGLRLVVAHELASQNQRAGIEALVSLLASSDAQVRLRSHSDLCWMTGRFAALAPLTDAAQVSSQQTQWTSWLVEAGVALRLPLPELEPALGRILICSAGFGKLYELDENLKDRWSIESPGVMRCLGLPNGHRLVTSQTNNTGFLQEYDAQGVLIRSNALRATADSLERLPSGSTLLTLGPLNQVVEVDDEGKTVWETSVSGTPTDARRLPAGRTLVALSQGNRVVEIDEKGAIVWEASNLSQPMAARRLPNGNTLIALRGGGAVIEVDPKSKIIWTAKGLKAPRLIERLPDGRTLVTDNDGLHILDAEGKIVASRSDLGPPSGLSAF